MVKSKSTVSKNYSKKYLILLVILLLISTAATLYFFLQPETITSEANGHTAQFETSFDYKATVTPNVLYPEGGTVDAGKTLFKKITTAIPFRLKSSLRSETEMTAKGTHEVQLVIKADEIWERRFPLEQQQAFEQTGTEISVIDHTYEIDLEQVKAFIMQVEDETGIRPSQYTIEVHPNIQGTIDDSWSGSPFQLQDKLIFQFSYDEIVLVSEENFTTIVTSPSSEEMPNHVKAFGLEVPLSFARLSTIILSVILLVTIIYVNRRLKDNAATPGKSEMEKINKRYASRIVPVSQKINMVHKSIFALQSFKSILKISDEKELPIFFTKDHKEDSGVYLIVDGDYLYTYETRKTNDPKITASSEQAYARG